MALISRVFGRGKAAKKDDKPPVQVDQEHYTTIEQVFRVIIFMNKLMGGCLMTCTSNKTLAIIYRITLTVATRYLSRRFFTSHARFHGDSMPKSLAVNMNIFFVLYSSSTYLAIIATMFTSARYHNTIRVVTKKRLDARYLKPFDDDSSEVLKAQEHGVQPGLTSEDRGQRSWWWFRLAHRLRSMFGRKLGQVDDILRGYAKGDKIPELSRVVSSVNMIRWLIVGYIVITGLLSLTREEYGNHGIARRLMDKLAQTNQLHLNGSAANMSSHGQQKLTLAVHRHLSYLQSIERNELLEFVTNYSKHLTYLVLVHLFFSASGFFQIYGHICINLCIMAVMTDMLRRVNEQDKGSTDAASSRMLQKNQYTLKSNPNSVEAGKQLSGSGGVRSQSVRVGETRDAAGGSSAPIATSTAGAGSRSVQVARSPPPVIQTSELLIQVRDVLATLRPALSLDYLVIATYEVSRLISTFGFFCVFITTRDLIWAAVVMLEYLRMCTCFVLIRLGHHLLHNEARKIKVTNNQRLVDNAVDQRGAEGAHDTRAESRNPSSRRSSGELPKGQLNLDRASRIETITNYRLAKEIEGLWPTDWFVPDIKSVLGQNFFVITFVGTLQQLVEVRSQIK